jgi:hypothetical protein
MPRASQLLTRQLVEKHFHADVVEVDYAACPSPGKQRFADSLESGPSPGDSRLEIRRTSIRRGRVRKASETSPHARAVLSPCCPCFAKSV